MLTRILAYGAYLKLAGWIAHLILSAGKAQSPERTITRFRRNPPAANSSAIIFSPMVKISRKS